MKAKHYHPVGLVQRWFSYDPDTGLLNRKLKRSSNHPDTLNPTRERVDFFGHRYRVTHIIWAVHFGKWPDEEIDHIDHNHNNNRLINLREATRSENMQNRRWSNPNGKGVTYQDGRPSPWQAQIAVEGKKIHLGFFGSKEEAAKAYIEAAIHYHGEFACLK